MKEIREHAYEDFKHSRNLKNIKSLMCKILNLDSFKKQCYWLIEKCVLSPLYILEKKEVELRIMKN